MTGMVYLVGAGPGDPGLVTVKGLELIKKADCIIYDRLAAPELLDYTRPECACIYVGKADSHHTLPQDEINALLEDMVHIHRCVVRLKGGDAFVFGRGGEEGLYLQAHGIPFTVVPGVSSAIAGAACAGIPVTHRGIATSFRVITAHRQPDGVPIEELIDFSTMLDVSETLIFLMGLGKVDAIAQGLIAAGRSADTPTAVISHGTMPEQRVCVGSLATIAERVQQQALTSPAMIIVGEVVTLRSRLDFFEKQPLFGKHYLVPKIGREPSRLALLLRKQGAKVTERMVGRIIGIPAVYTAKELSQLDLLLFTSVNGVQYFMRNLYASNLDARALAHAKIAAIGSKTADMLQTYGLRADLTPEQNNSTALVAAVRHLLESEGGRSPFERAIAWYPTAKNADDELVDALLEVCDCGRLNVYENVSCDFADFTDAGAAYGFGGLAECDLAAYDGILFTCASSAQRLLAPVAEDTRTLLGTHTTVYSIGPKCSAALSALGVTPVTEAHVSSFEGLLNTVLNR